MSENNNATTPGANFPVPLRNASPEAYEKAPTLMAGNAAGSQGAVQVWSPNRDAIRRNATLSLLSVAPIPLYLYLTVLMAGLGVTALLVSALFFLVAVDVTIWFAVPGICSLPVFRRPCYITTDEAGIGITTWNGSHAALWDDIVGFHYTGLAIILNLRSGKNVVAHLAGYSHEDRRILLEQIIERAGLPEPVRRRGTPVASLQPGYRRSKVNNAAVALKLPPGNPGRPALPSMKQ